jgi:hypothetical protein
VVDRSVDQIERGLVRLSQRRRHVFLFPIWFLPIAAGSIALTWMLLGEAAAAAATTKSYDAFIPR